MDNIYFLGIGKGRVDPFIRDHLFTISQDMIRDEIGVQHLVGQYTGRVWTDGKFSSIGLVSGQVFHAEVAGLTTDLQASFIVRKTDYRGKIDWIP